ncbi:Ger(x)C family spore germination C-terminal domain-containing protein [Cohnella fermenti]|uniref:Ger(X)C family spore germination protein n=1 Tax=Cohnella fermenti TaxID=2565925 RepID=A0A4V3WFA4_9BACL|nr:Ger(x)C family spore germination C-terminal domain-containing protein [Cohnella fermenti]THF79490.1 hypothetical protein E6C55_11930 [Cohnella fermenti]
MAGKLRGVRRLGGWGAALLACLGMTGCWDEVMIQDLHYITALGFSYNDKKQEYEVFAQIIDLAGVAKKGNSSSERSASVFGHDKGATPSVALDNLFHTMQMSPNLDHVMAIVIDPSSAPVLPDMLDGVDRNSAIRYAIHLLGTDSPLGELFSSTGRNALSPLNTDIYQPNSNRASLPFTTKNQVRDVVKSLKSCPCPLYIPLMRLDGTHWELNSGLRLDLPSFQGAFVMDNGRYAGQFGEAELFGVRWFQGVSNGRQLTVTEGEKVSAVLRIKSSSADYRYDKEPTPTFTLSLTVRALLSEYVDHLTEQQIEERAEQEIKDQIEASLKLAGSKSVDLFGFEEYLYRHRSAEWKRLKQRNETFEKLPAKVEVKVHLVHSGKMKLQKS